MDILKRIVFGFAVLLSCGAANAASYDIEVNGIYYNYIANEKISPCMYVVAGPEKYEGEVVIPASISYKGRILPVKGIGGSAFQDCTDLTSVTIPPTDSLIGGRAFAGCTHLQSVALQEGVTVIGDRAFYGCTRLTNITLPNSLTTLEGYAFSNCIRLTSINIPKGLTEIETNVFENCTRLSSIIIPKNITMLIGSAFKNCGLKSIKFDDNSNITGSGVPGAFPGCSPTEVYFGGIIKGFHEYNTAYMSWEADSIRKLTFGKYFTSIPTSSLEYKGANIEVVNAMMEDPSKISFKPNFYSSTYKNATLYVPVGKTSLYKATDGWKQFYNIKEKDFETGVVVTHVDSVVIKTKELHLEGIGKTAKLDIVIYPSNATYKGIQWSSDNEDVCTIDNNGVVTSIGAGNATITGHAIDGGYTVTCSITVSIPVTSLEITPNTVNFDKLGQTKQLEIIIEPDNATDKVIKWKSANESVCYVSPNGQIIAMGEGTTVILATTTDGNKSATCVVTVNTSTGINSVTNSKGEQPTYYNVNGVRLTTPLRGVNIVKYGNGEVKKVIKR